MAPVPTRHGTFVCLAWRAAEDDVDHLAFVRGDLSGGPPRLADERAVAGGDRRLGDHDDAALRAPAMADELGDRHLHEPVRAGERRELRAAGHRAAVGRHDLGEDAGRLQAGQPREIDRGQRVVVYLRGHEGRGIGIASKLDAYRLQDGGHDTVDANLHLGLPVDSRDYGTGAQILLALGAQRLRLITNNPAKCEDLDEFGIEVVERVALPVRPTPENITYLETKRRRMGHLLGGLEATHVG